MSPDTRVTHQEVVHQLELEKETEELRKQTLLFLASLTFPITYDELILAFKTWVKSEARAEDIVETATAIFKLPTVSPTVEDLKRRASHQY